MELKTSISSVQHFKELIDEPVKLLDDLRKISNEVVFIQTGPNFIEIMPADVDSGNSSTYIHHHYYTLPLPEITTYGDSGNAIGLFKFSSKSVTRSCGPEYVKKEATCTYDDGPSMFVKSAVERCVLSKSKEKK